MGTRWNRVVGAVLTTVPRIYVLSRNIKKNIRIFLLENFHFWVVKFSVYLNKHVFVVKLFFDFVDIYPNITITIFLCRTSHVKKCLPV